MSHFYVQPKNGHKQTSKSGKTAHNTTSENPANFFKSKNIRVFAYSDQYALVNSANEAFMFFKKCHTTNPLLPTISHINFSSKIPLEKLPNAVLVRSSNISKANIEFMVHCYLEAINVKGLPKKFKRKFGVSIEFAQYIAMISAGSYEEACTICSDIQEAKFYLQNNTSKSDCRSCLIEGSRTEKLKVLRQLLSPETYIYLNILKLGHEKLEMIINEIIG